MTASFGIEVMVLLAAAMLGIVIAKRFGQSSILGEILIGVIIGPTVLNFVGYDEPVRVLAEMGAIVMLFTIGLECNYREVFNLKNTAVAILGVIVPFAAGWGLSVAFGYHTLEALFIATAFTATSIAITAHILHERNMLSSPVAKTIIGAAVVDDILGLLALSIITSLSGALTPGAVVAKAGIALAFVIGCVLLIKPMNWLLRHVHVWTKTATNHATFFASMLIMFGYAGLASVLGLSSIVGAFLAGLTLAEDRLPKDVREGSEYLQTLFSAIFFVSLGLAVNFTTLPVTVWIFAGACTLVAALSKFIGCMLPARWFGHTWREAAIVGFGMIPRGEVAMIVGLLGLTAGIITQNVYGAIIVMAFVTTIVTPILLRWSLPQKTAHH